MNYYSALYIPQEKIKPITSDPAAVSRIKDTLAAAMQKANVNQLNYNLTNLSKNMAIMATTELTQRYVAAAVSKIISGEPITSRTLLDTLFNTYAPAFNGMLEQMGYNSITQMRDAARAGILNVPNFLNGFSNTLAVVTETFFSDSQIEKYGEEIPIDVIEQFESEYESQVAAHPFAEGVDIRDYVKNLGEVKMKILAHVRNNTGRMWSIGDFSNKILDAMDQKRPVLFRMGKDIYENVLITYYKPTITNIYDISFEMKLSHKRFLGRKSRVKNGGYRVMNGTVRDEIAYMFASEEYIGEGKVEEVTIEDTALIEGIKKALGLLTVKVQGQDV